MRLNSFWGHFEEPATEDVSNEVQGEILMGTKTKTATREELDQDRSACGYHALPIAVLGTKTLTEQREEPDQDNDNLKYRTLGNKWR